MTLIGVSWFVVALRMIDGFLWGSGFVLALLVGYGIFNLINGKKKGQA